MAKKMIRTMKGVKGVVALVALLLAFGVPAARGEEPDHKKIDYRFFKCEESRHLQGGVYGKGPFKRFGPSESKCKKNEWLEIDREEFKRLATEWYGYDWSKEIPFWSRTKSEP